MSFNSYVSKQFSDPRGIGGSIISFIMNRQNRPLYDETIRLLAVSKSDSILDVGCGNGYVLNLLARKHDASFVGIDLSASIIESASRRNHKFKNMQLRIQDVSAMSFGDGAFSKAYTINTVYFWNDLNRVMRELWRVLEPGGMFINTLYTNETLSRFSHTQIGYRQYDAHALTNAGKEIGFLVEAIPIAEGMAVSYRYRKP